MLRRQSRRAAVAGMIQIGACLLHTLVTLAGYCDSSTRLGFN
jgi:hypothetical protein